MKNIIKIKHLICGLAAMLVYGCSENDTPPLEEPSDSRYSIAITVKNNSLASTRTAVVDPGEDIYGKHESSYISISRKTRTIPVWQVKI